MTLISAAREFARRAHEGQFRHDGTTPYFQHCEDVEQVLLSVGVSDPLVLATSLLHDTIEDTKTSPHQIWNIFGPDIEANVVDLTFNAALHNNKTSWLRAIGEKSTPVILVKLADRLCNLHDTPKNPWNYACDALTLVNGVLRDIGRNPDRWDDQDKFAAMALIRATMGRVMDIHATFPLMLITTDDAEPDKESVEQAMKAAKTGGTIAATNRFSIQRIPEVCTNCGHTAPDAMRCETPA